MSAEGLRAPGWLHWVAALNLLVCPPPPPTPATRSALARSLPLAPDAALDEVGYAADHFSGADLGALLSEAQLAAVHEVLGDGGSSSSGGTGAAAAAPTAAAAAAAPHMHEPPVVAQRHLDAALDTARPSVPADERARLEALYSRFQQSREPGGAAAAVDKGKMVSWA